MRISELAEKLRPYFLDVLGRAEYALASYLTQAGADDRYLRSYMVRRYDPVADAISYYTPTAAGLSSAIGDASSGETIWVPPGTYSGDLTIPAGVTVIGLSREDCVLTGQVTLGNGSVLENLSVERSASQAADLITVQGPGSGTAYIRNCDLQAHNSSGDGYAAYTTGGIIELHDCNLSAQSAGADSTPFSGSSGGTWHVVSTAGSDVVLYVAGGSSLPTNWETEGFDDSAWSATAERALFPPYPPADSGDWVKESDTSRAVGDFNLYRRDFSLVADPGETTLYIGADNHVDEAYINGVQIVSSPTAFDTQETFTVSAGTLKAGTNVIAVKVRNGAGGGRLSLNYGLYESSSAPSELIKAIGCYVANETGRDIAIPLYGDRGAWRINYGEGAYHARDIAKGAETRHTPLSTYVQTSAPTANDDSDDGYGVGSRWFDIANDAIYECVDASVGAAVWQQIGDGDVSGPGSSTDNAIARFDGTDGKAIQNSLVLIDDDGTTTLPDSASHPPLNVTERSSAPSSPSTGDIYLDDGTNTGSGNPGWRRYDGSVWEDISASVGSLGGTPTTSTRKFWVPGASGGDDTDNSYGRILADSAVSRITGQFPIPEDRSGTTDIVVQAFLYSQGTGDVYCFTEAEFGTTGEAYDTDAYSSGTSAVSLPANQLTNIQTVTLQALAVSGDIVTLTFWRDGGDASDSHGQCYFMGWLVSYTAETGSGDMTKAVYDTDDDGLVDGAEQLDDGINTVTAAQARTHIDDADKHREINDAGTAATDLWSADKITTALASKSDTGHSHSEDDITDLDHTDADAIHDNVAGEINAITEKASPVDADLVVIEDSEDSNNKKKVQVGNLPGGSGSGSHMLLYTQTVTQSIANTTTKTNLLNAGRGSKTLSANLLSSGDVIRIHLTGQLSDTGTPSPTISIELGGTVLATATPTLSGVTSVDWHFDIIITCRTSGASGAFLASGLFDYDEGSEISLESAAEVTVDTTAALEVQVNWTWDVASASNDIDCRQATIEHLNVVNLAPVAPTGLTATETV